MASAGLWKLVSDKQASLLRHVMNGGERKRLLWKLVSDKHASLACQNVNDVK